MEYLVNLIYIYHNLIHFSYYLNNIYPVYAGFSISVPSGFFNFTTFPDKSTKLYSILLGKPDELKLTFAGILEHNSIPLSSNSGFIYEYSILFKI